MVSINFEGAKQFYASQPDKTAAQAAFDTLVNGTGAGNDFIGWVDLPVNYDREEFARIQAVAKKIQSDSKALVVIGIGGSYLGARYAIRGGSKKIRNMMFVVLALLFIKMGYELLF